MVHPEAKTHDPEAFPTRQDLIRAGILALGSGIFGFVVTYTIFIKPHVRAIDLSGLDRRGAERPLSAVYTDPKANSVYDFPYAPAGSGRSSPDEKAVVQLPDPKAPSRKRKQIAQPGPTATPTSLPLPGIGYQRGSSTRRAETAAAVAPPPEVMAPSRPPVVSYSEAWKQASGGWAMMGDAIRVGGEGVLVAPGELLTTLSAYRYTGGRGMLGGQPFTSSPIAMDAARDLALLRITGADGVPVPLSPDSSSAGDLLVCGDALRPGSFQEVRSRGQADSWIGFYGWTSGSAGGAPLINNRGEVVALSLPRPAWNSMAWSQAIPATTLQTFLRQRPAAGAVSPPSGLDSWSRGLASHVTALAERTRPSRANARILPGEAVGNFPLGMTTAQLEAELGAGKMLEQQGSFQRRHYDIPRLTFTLVEGRTVAIETEYSFYTLEGGWAANSRVDASALRAKLPELVMHQRERFSSACSPGLELLFSGEQITTIRVVPR